VLNGGSEDVPIDYSTFRTELEAGNVQRITVSGQEITGQLQEASVTELKAGEPVTYTSSSLICHLLEMIPCSVCWKPQCGY
jgi:hypothetical protein